MPKGQYKRSKTFTNFKDQKRNNKKENKNNEADADF